MALIAIFLKGLFKHFRAKSDFGGYYTRAKNIYKKDLAPKNLGVLKPQIKNRGCL